MMCPLPARPKGEEADERGSDDSAFLDLLTAPMSNQSNDSAATRDNFLRPADMCQSSGISSTDWDILFRAVEERLKRSIGERLSATAQAQPRDATSRVQTIVLECVEELDKLHTALKQERCQHDEFER